MILHYPWVFILFPFCIVFLYWMNQKKNNLASLDYPMGNKNFSQYESRTNYKKVLFLLNTIIIFFILLALSRPQTSSSSSKRFSEGIDIMVALDVSKSMLIEDYNNQNRLEVAKETIREFVQKRTDDRIGFLMFSGEGITLCPPTLDYEVLDAAIEAANTEQLKDGTAIGDALAGSVNRLKESAAKSKIIILVTDGDNNMGSVAPLTAGSLAKGYGIKVYSIALGRQGIVNMPVTVSFFGQNRKQYQRVSSTINPELLMKISEETGGKFFRASEEGSLKKIMNEINKLERNTVETKNRVRWTEHFQLPLLFAILLFLIEYILIKTRYRILPN